MCRRFIPSNAPVVEPHECFRGVGDWLHAAASGLVPFCAIPLLRFQLNHISKKRKVIKERGWQVQALLIDEAVTNQ